MNDAEAGAFALSGERRTLPNTTGWIGFEIGLSETILSDLYEINFLQAVDHAAYHS
jgi:hypothetical protein